MKGTVMPIYSFGADSPLKLELTEDYVEAYNRVARAFFDAQELHEFMTGREWTPNDPVYLNVSDDDLEAWNKFNGILQKALERHGKPVHESELYDAYLIKN